MINNFCHCIFIIIIFIVIKAWGSQSLQSQPLQSYIYYRLYYIYYMFTFPIFIHTPIFILTLLGSLIPISTAFSLNSTTFFTNIWNAYPLYFNSSASHSNRRNPPIMRLCRTFVIVVRLINCVVLFEILYVLVRKYFFIQASLFNLYSSSNFIRPALHSAYSSEDLQESSVY